MMIDNKSVFNSKILLFGEYTLIKGSMALSIPFDKYYGQLLFDNNVKNTASTHYSVAYLTEYLNFLQNAKFENKININAFKKDILQGLIFETNIPISYGLGSSGAIVASIYNAYAKTKTSNVNELVSIFAKMESYYHGKSSGLDPLVSYLNKAILITKNHEFTQTSLPKNNLHNHGGIFLIDTNTTGETQPLVSWFLNEYKKPDYKDAIQNQLIPLNNNGISHMLSGDFNSLLNTVKSISHFTFDNFKPMIPNTVKQVWKTGLETNNYYIKLCGSGGGGMMLGFTKNLNRTLDELSEFNTIVLGM